MQTKRFIKFANWIFIIYQAIIILMVLNGAITFGNGLGDLGMLIEYGVVTILLVFLNIWALNKEKLNGNAFLLYCCFIGGLVAVVTLTLYFTIWRGSEYPWNGHIFVG